MLDRLKTWARDRLRAWLLPPVAERAEPEEAEAPRRRKINEVAVAMSRVKEGEERRQVVTFKIPEPPPGVPKSAKLAMDNAMRDNFSWAQQGAISFGFAEGLEFLGYAYLSELTQRPEYRRPSEIIAQEMTRKWIKFQSTGQKGGEDKSAKIRLIEAEFKRLKVQDRFREVTEHDGFFGRGHIFLDFGPTVSDNDAEMQSRLSDTFAKVGGLKLERLVVIEPIWIYPDQYNSIDPLHKDFYKPTGWFALGRRVHASRLLTFVGREVPDMLKPAYSFGGLSLSQMCKPYVDNWLRTRQSVSDLIHSFSVSGLKTDMSSILEEGGDGTDLYNRIRMFNQMRDNKGAMVLDKDAEEWFNQSTPLNTLDKLQAQAQEHMSSVSGIPLVKLLGITPSGLNASSDGEIRVFYDGIEAKQEAEYRDPLTKISNIVQIGLFGQVDPEIGFVFNPLFALDKKGLAEVDKLEAETDDMRINGSVIDPIEARTRLATQEDSPYASLDLNKVIEPPAPPNADPFGVGADPTADPAQTNGAAPPAMQPAALQQ